MTVNSRSLASTYLVHKLQVCATCPPFLAYEAGPHAGAQYDAGILMHQLPTCWDYRCVVPFLALTVPSDQITIVNMLELERGGPDLHKW